MLEVPALAVVTGLLSLVITLATVAIRNSYNDVKGSLNMLLARMEQFNTHKIVHEEWKKNAEKELRMLRKRCTALEISEFGHQRQADEDPSGE